jgi:hypothetical protein
MADLNEEITLSNGRRISLARLLHEHALLVKFVVRVASGATADKPAAHEPGHVPGPYVNRRIFQRQSQQEATNLLKELGITAQE